MTNKNNDFEWVPYDEDRECKFLNNNNIIVVKPKEYKPLTLFCPMCRFPIKSLEDVLSLKDPESNCCESCKLWKAGLQDLNISKEKKDKMWESYMETKSLRAKMIKLKFK